jgi:hypothetical protein
MKRFKELSLAVALALATVLSVAANSQTTPKKAPAKTETCCGMACCKDGSCCNGDSCEMKGTSKNHSSKHDCCCKGDSCEMGQTKNKEKQG